AVEALTPDPLEVRRTAEQLHHRPTDERVSAPAADPRDHREDLLLRAATAQGRDQRLLDGDGAIGPAVVSPALESVGAREVPGAAGRGLIVVEREVNRGRHLLERVRKAEVRGSVEHGI